MPSVDVEGAPVAADVPKEENKTLSGPVIGIIYPPPEVRSILCKKNPKHLQTFYPNFSKKLYIFLVKLFLNYF